MLQLHPLEIVHICNIVGFAVIQQIVCGLIIIVVHIWPKGLNNFTFTCMSITYEYIQIMNVHLCNKIYAHIRMTFFQLLLLLMFFIFIHIFILFFSILSFK